MMVDLSSVIEAIKLLRHEKPEQIWRLFAFLLVPLGGLAGGLLSVSGQAGLHISQQPISVSYLSSEISAEGNIEAKDGTIVLFEPVEGEYFFNVEDPQMRIWSSLTKNSARRNRSHLQHDSFGVTMRTPFLGESGPTAILVHGKVGKDVAVPGGILRVGDLTTVSNRTVSIASGVLFACIFALGLSFSTGIPAIKCDERIRS